MSLDDLQKRLALSDREAFGILFDRMRQPLFAYVRQIAGGEDAYDVLQDVFLKLWEDRHQLEVHTGISPLLYRMARNRALNLTRKMKRITLPGELPEGSAPPEEVSDLGNHIRSWIGRLPPRRAEAFQLSRYHDLSHAEISRIMGLSVRTVQTHIVHALRDLRLQLDQWRTSEGTTP